MSLFFSLGISMSCLFALWKITFKSRCCGLFVSVSRCRAVLVPKSWCHGFLVLESRCRGICSSTASFPFSQNLLYYIINVHMWVVNWHKLLCISRNCFDSITKSFIILTYFISNNSLVLVFLFDLANTILFILHLIN